MNLRELVEREIGHTGPYWLRVVALCTLGAVSVGSLLSIWAAAYLIGRMAAS